ncbi:MAG: tetratricopeptide repeat protein, partial [bacterium]|nr:tetratricopeptide repeat protein [bacterium]
GHGWVIAQVLGLDYEKDEEVELQRQLVGVGLGELLPYGHLRLHPALGPLLRSELGEAKLEEARRAWVEAMVTLAGNLYQHLSQDAQLAATLTVLELPNLLGALELLQVSAGAEEVVGVATTIEGLLQVLGRPRAMARVVRVREAASEGLGEWSHGRFLAEDAAVDRLLEAGRFAEAVQAAQVLLQRTSAAGEGTYEGASYDLGMAHFSLGRALKKGGAAEAALGPLAEAREGFQKLGDVGAKMASASTTERADCLRDLGQFDEAAAAYEESIELDNARGDLRDVAVGQGQLGTVRMLQQRYGDALSAWNEARKTFEQLGEPGSVASAWHQIGLVSEQARQYEAAEHAYQQALKIRVQQRDRSGEALTLGQLGNLYNGVGRREDAVRFYRQAAEIRTELGDLMKEGRSRNNLGDILVQLQRYDDARQEILRAIECKKPYGHAAQPWTTFDILHDLERAVGNASAAESARDDAIAAFLAYRRAGGENHTTGAQLAAVVGQAVTSGETAGVASQLAELGARPDLPDYLRTLVPVLQQIVDGSRDPALASTAGLFFMDAVEVGLLLERLG